MGSFPPKPPDADNRGKIDLCALGKQISVYIKSRPLPLAHLEESVTRVSGGLLSRLTGTDRLLVDIGLELSSVGDVLAH